MDKQVVIKSLNIRPVRVPMLEPHRTASGVIEVSPLVLLDIETSAGVVGRSITFTYTPAALEPCAGLMTSIAPLLEGQVAAPLDIERMLQARFRLLGTQGLVGMVLAAIDMALWDAVSRLHEVSLTTLLGGSAGGIKTYGAVGYDGIDGSARAAAVLVEKGFIGLKAKIGYPTAQDDLAVVQAMRKAVGDDIAIMVDYNQSLDPVEAVRRIRMLDDEGLDWVEEPVLAHDYAASARLCRNVKTPIQSGENWWGTRDLEHALAAGASTLVMPDVMKTGGVSGWIRAAALADAKQVPMSSHLWPELSARLLRCTPTAHWLEYSDWWSDIIVDPIPVQDGLAMVDDQPGSGYQWNEKAVEKFAL